ncbi:hypothetical protein G7067_05575 [Leucobacter insecticola]|uniref:DUF2511 domain-containing protein n=1 Tax=Leucobacter insecticola TaxID=2714934 RepID=A0A6G8FI13_9MICO|nr:hypothetical protein [Leucobacter insecticola]QIM16004.1 hypothetical protein G7067_05575 [Leucobacter insecticola]
MHISLARWTLLGGTAASALFLAGCGALHPQDFPLDDPEHTTTESAGNVSRELLGSSWPLDVESGDVACEQKGDDVALTFTSPAGEVYALNLIAAADHPKATPVTGKTLGVLVSKAFEACDTKE